MAEKNKTKKQTHSKNSSVKKTSVKKIKSKKNESKKEKKGVKKKNNVVKLKKVSVVEEKNKLPAIKYLSKLIPKPVRVAAFFVTIIFLALYIYTAPRTNVSYADSDELLTVGYNLGVAHPPGYGLYILLLHFFTNLPIPGSVAFRGAVLSALLHSLTLGVMVVANWRLVEFLKVNYKKKISLIHDKYDSLIVSTVSTAALGTSYMFWLLGIIPEKYALLSLFSSLMLLILVFLMTTQKKLWRNSWWLSLMFIFGLMIAYHLTAIVFIPIIGMVIWQTNYYKDLKKIALMCVMFVFGILVTAGLLYWLNTIDSSVSWNFPQNINGLLSHMIRSDFVGKSLNSGVQTTYFGTFDINKMVETIPFYTDIISQHWGWIIMLVMALGVYAVYLNRWARWIMITAVGSVAIFLPLYLGEAFDVGGIFVTIRQYMMSYVVLSMVTASGFWFLLTRLKQGYQTLELKSSYFGIASVIFLSLFIVRNIYANFNEVNLRDYDFINRFYSQMLNDLPKDSVLGCFTDTACFALLYNQYVEGVRNDVVIIPPAYPLVQKRLDKNPDLRGYDYPDNPFLMFDYLTWNIGKRPVFVTDLSRQYYDYLGINYGFSYYIPHGYYAELTHEVPESLPEIDYSFSDELKEMGNSRKDLMKDWHKVIVARTHMLNGSEFLKMDRRDKTLVEMNRMADLLFLVDQVGPAEIELSRTNVENSAPYANFSPESKSQTVLEILDIVDAFIGKNRLNNAYEGAIGALVVDPLHEKARMKLAELYEKMGDNNFALTEYKNVYKYYPDNKEAKNKIDELEGIRTSGGY